MQSRLQGGLGGATSSQLQQQLDRHEAAIGELHRLRNEESALIELGRLSKAVPETVESCSRNDDRSSGAAPTELLMRLKASTAELNEEILKRLKLEKGDVSELCVVVHEAVKLYEEVRRELRSVSEQMADQKAVVDNLRQLQDKQQKELCDLPKQALAAQAELMKELCTKHRDQAQLMKELGTKQRDETAALRVELTNTLKETLRGVGAHTLEEHALQIKGLCEQLWVLDEQLWQVDKRLGSRINEVSQSICISADAREAPCGDIYGEELDSATCDVGSPVSRVTSKVVVAEVDSLLASSSSAREVSN